MGSQYVHTVSVNHIGSANADHLSRHHALANHHSETLQAGAKPLFGYTSTEHKGMRWPAGLRELPSRFRFA